MSGDDGYSQGFPVGEKSFGLHQTPEHMGVSEKKLAGHPGGFKVKISDCPYAQE
jgi:hypothetical protein